jgi:hypothetical protein
VRPSRPTTPSMTADDTSNAFSASAISGTRSVQSAPTEHAHALIFAPADESETVVFDFIGHAQSWQRSIGWRSARAGRCSTCRTIGSETVQLRKLPTAQNENPRMGAGPIKLTPHGGVRRSGDYPFHAVWGIRWRKPTPGGRCYFGPEFLSRGGPDNQSGSAVSRFVLLTTTRR